jgi:hypothetical protein
VTPGLKYTLARVGIFAVCTVPAILLLPSSLDLLVRIFIGAVLSAVISVVALARLRGQMADQINTVVEQRRVEKEKLRAALAGDDEEETGSSAKA